MKFKVLWISIIILLPMSLLCQTTPNLNLNIPVHGTPNWDILMNTNFTSLDSYLGGVLSFPNALKTDITGTAQHSLNLPTDFATQSASNPQAGKFSTVAAGTQVALGNGKQPIYLSAYGAVCNSDYMYGAFGGGAGVAVASGSQILTSSGGFPKAPQVGESFMVDGAGVSGGLLTSTVLSVDSSTQIHLSVSASTTVTAASAVWGTDDTAAIQAATAAAAGTTLIYPQGWCLVTSSINLTGQTGSTVQGTNSTLGGILWAGSTPVPILDETASHYMVINNLNVLVPLQTGAATVGLLNARNVSQGGAGVNDTHNLQMTGFFTVAAKFELSSEVNHDYNPAWGNYATTWVQSGTYTSGGTITGAAGNTCTLTGFDNGSAATATVTLTDTNTIASGTPLLITLGAGTSTPPDTATLGNGTATCSGTASISTVLGNYVFVKTDTLSPWNVASMYQTLPSVGSGGNTMGAMYGGQLGTGLNFPANPVWFKQTFDYTFNGTYMNGGSGGNALITLGGTNVNLSLVAFRGEGQPNYAIFGSVPGSTEQNVTITSGSSAGGSKGGIGDVAGVTWENLTVDSYFLFTGSRLLNVDTLVGSDINLQGIGGMTVRTTATKNSFRNAVSYSLNNISLPACGASNTGNVLYGDASVTFDGKIITYLCGTSLNVQGDLTVGGSGGTNIAPSLTTPNWTLGTGWTYGTSPNSLNKSTTGTGTAQPATPLTVTAGITYMVTIQVASVSAGNFSYTFGGTPGSLLAYPVTYVDFVTAGTTGNLIFTPSVTGALINITSISVQQLTVSTGSILAAAGLTTGYGSSVTTTNLVGQQGTYGPLINVTTPMQINGNMYVAAGNNWYCGLNGNATMGTCNLSWYDVGGFTTYIGHPISHTINVSIFGTEVARFNSLYHFLVGTQTDCGAEVCVNGEIKTSGVWQPITPISLPGTNYAFNTWTLPAGTWSWACHGTYTLAGGTAPTLTLGINTAANLISETATATIWSTQTGTETDNTVTLASAGSTAILTGATTTTANTKWEMFGTVQLSAAQNVLLYAYASGSPTTATINVGSSCTIW